MTPLTEPEIRASFVNCSRGETKRLPVPRDLAAHPWADLDYLGWRDPQGSNRGYLIAETDEGPVGIVLRAPESTVGAGKRRSMCSLCVTARSGGVSLMVAPRAGRAGQQGHSVGTYICSDLRCPLYLRGKLSTGSVGMNETLTLEEKAARLKDNLTTFVARVRSAA